MANNLDKVIALANLGEAVLAAVKESGLMRKRHRASSSNGRRVKRRAKVIMETEAVIARPRSKASKKSVARRPLLERIPDA